MNQPTEATTRFINVMLPRFFPDARWKFRPEKRELVLIMPTLESLNGTENLHFFMLIFNQHDLDRDEDWKVSIEFGSTKVPDIYVNQ